MKKYIAMLLAAVCVFGSAACGYQKKLTLNKVIELSAKGEELTWSDFEKYKSIETGSGLYILVYEIDETYDLWVGGVPDSAPMYIRLVTKENMDNYIDVRTGDVRAFIEANAE